MSSDPEERRLSVRIRKHQHVEVQTLDANQPSVRGQIMNISEGGLRFVSSASFLRGEVLTVTVADECLPSKVHECKALYSGYATRAEFIRSEEWQVTKNGS
jgi:hypothetical protein